MLLKVCTGCHQEKPLTEYYPRRDRPSGVLSRCKTCTQRDVTKRQKTDSVREQRRKRYAKNPEPYQLRNKHNYTQHRAARLEAMHAYRKKNQEALRAYDRSRHTSPKRQEQTQISRAKNAEHIRKQDRERYRNGSKSKIWRAHYAVSHALKHGLLRTQVCQVCHSPQANAHHEDYTKPLTVIWLCYQHHADRHRVLRRGT